MRPLLKVAAFVFPLSLSLFVADTPAPEPTVEQLIERLADKNYQVREEAARAIEKRGPEALPALRKAKDHPDPEVRRRIENWIPQFETAAFVAATRVSLDLTDRTLPDALRELAKQSRYGFALEPDKEKNQRLYHFKFDKVPFWQALDETCNQVGAVPKLDRPDGRILVTYADRPIPHIYHKGAFRLVARDLRGAEITFDFSAEPRLVLLHVGMPTLSEAVDDLGMSLVTVVEPGPGRLVVFDNNRCYEWNKTVPLKKPSKETRQVKLLKGWVAMRIEKERKTTVIEGILEAKGKKVKVGEHTFEIGEVTSMKNKQYRVVVVMTNVAPNQTFHVGAWDLLDAKGVKFKRSNPRIDPDRDRVQTYRLEFDFAPPDDVAIGAPEKLVFSRTSSIIDHVMEFEFKDLPLP